MLLGLCAELGHVEVMQQVAAVVACQLIIAPHQVCESEELLLCNVARITCV